MECQGNAGRMNEKHSSSSLLANKKMSDTDCDVESVEFDLEIEAALDEVSFGDEVFLEEGGSVKAGKSEQFKEIMFRQQPENKDVVKKASNFVNLGNKSKSDAGKNNDTAIISNDGKEIQMQSSKGSHRSGALNTKPVSLFSSRESTEVLENAFILDAAEDDPFADFASNEQNNNDFYATKANARDHQSSGNSAKSSHNNQSVTHAAAVSKPLETLVEASEEESEIDGRINEKSNSIKDDLEEEDHNPDDGDNDGDNNSVPEIQEIEIDIEAKFDEITANLNAKIESLRAELRREIRKEKSCIREDLGTQMRELESRLESNEDERRQQSIGSETKMLHRNTVNEVPFVTSCELDKLRKELLYLKQDVQGEQFNSLNDLRNEISRDLKTKTSAISSELENKFYEFKEDNQREIRSMRNELTNAISSTKTITSTAMELKDDLAQALLQIEKLRKEQHKHVETVTHEMNEERQSVQKELDRLHKVILQEREKAEQLESEARQTEQGSCLQQLREVRQTVQQSTEKNKEEINELRQLHEQFRQQVDRLQSRVESSSEKEMQEERKNTNETNKSPESAIAAEAFQRSSAPAAIHLESDLIARIAAIEKNVKHISESLNDLKLIQRAAGEQKIKLVTDAKKVTAQTNGSMDAHFSDQDSNMRRTDSTITSTSASEINRPAKKSAKRKKCSRTERSQGDWEKGDVVLQCSHLCRHRDENHPSQCNYQLMKMPLMTTKHDHALARLPEQTRFEDIRASSSSLLNLIKKTTRMLREEALELESLGNYRFKSDVESILAREETDGDEETLRKLKLIRGDVDDKLKRLTFALNQQKTSQI